MRHIIITGRNGVGKSALIQTLSEKITLPISGVITKKEAPRADGYSPVYIHRYGEKRHYTEENCIGLCREGSSIPFPEVFDRFAESLDLPMDGVIVLDELGFLESKATVFTGAILRLMNEAPLILAAVRDKDTPFLNALRAHPRADVYRIDVDNRDLLRERLISKLPYYLNGAFPSSSSEN